MDRIENVLDTGGRRLSPADTQFVTTLLSELEQFQYQAPKDRALMFHPLGGFQRYLIHKVTEVFPKLTSFSIGDDAGRRTVVCFKSKKKDQQRQQQMQAAGGGAGQNGASRAPPVTLSPSSQVRGRASRDTLQPAARSRESSRTRASRKQQPVTDSPRSRTAPRPSAKLSESVGHLPRPLRSKKTTTKREQMKRSRSLQSSPVRLGDEFLSDDGDDDVASSRGRPHSSTGHPRKHGSRSASVKSSASRTRRNRDEPAMSEPEAYDEHSIERRTQGLHMEGKVVNGDVADPYSAGDSESDQGRVDAVAVTRHRHHHQVITKQPASTRRRRTTSSPPSDDERRRASATKAKRVTSESDDTCSDDDDDDDRDSAAATASPPSYQSLKRDASLRKVERNLDRIRRRSSSAARKDSAERESSGSAESRRQLDKSSTKSTTKARATTMPRQASASSPAVVGKKSHTLRNGRDRATKVDSDAVVDVDGRRKKSRDEKPDRASKDTLLSDSTLYMSLPDSAESTSKEKRRSKKSSKHRQSEVAAAPLEPAAPAQCDGEAQTVVSGTLTRRHGKKSPSPPAPVVEKEATKSADEEPPVAVAPTPVATHQNFNPGLLQAFHEFIQQQQAPPPPNPAPIHPLPPHLAHQLYLSWLSAYYAGATGVWPPPAPPSFIMPQRGANFATPFDAIPSFLNPTTAPGAYAQYPPAPEPRRPAPPDAAASYYPYFPTGYAPSPPSSYPPTAPDDAKYQPAAAASNSSFDEYPPSSNKASYSRRYSLERACQSDSTHGSATGCAYDELPAAVDANETDASSIGSRGEVAVANNPKGGVVIYVRGSQASSRCNSASGGAATTASQASTGADSQTTAPASGDARKSSYRRKAGKHRASTPSASKQDRKRGERDVTPPPPPQSNFTQAPPNGDVVAPRTFSNRNNNNQAMHDVGASSRHDVTATVTTTEQPPPLLSSAAVDSVSVADDKFPPPPGAAGGTSHDGLSHEEMILSLRRAPLATMDDDADGYLSPHSPPPRDDDAFLVAFDEPATSSDARSLESSSLPPPEVMTSSSTVSDDDDDDDKDETKSDDDSSDSLDEAATGAAPIVKTTSPPSDDDEERIPEPEATPAPAPLEPTREDDRALLAPPPPLRSASSLGSVETNPSDSCASGSVVTTSSGCTPPPPLHTSTAVPSDQDDQSANHQNNGGDEYDYYGWDPKKDKWRVMDRFVELYDFDPALSDVDIASRLDKYRGLRLSRVDRSHALCILPTSEQAQRLLADDYNLFSARQIQHASRNTKQKAERKFDQDQREAESDHHASSDRKTSNEVAKRMIYNSLGKSPTANSTNNNNKNHAKSKSKSHSKVVTAGVGSL